MLKGPRERPLFLELSLMEPMRITIRDVSSGYMSMFRRLTHPGFRIAYASLLIGVGAAVVAGLGSMTLIQGSLLTLGSVFGAFIAYSVRFNRNLKQVFKGNPWMVADQELEISEQGILRRLKYQESRFDWPFFQSVIDGPEGLALMTGSSSFLFIPRDALDHLGTEFRALVERHHTIRTIR